MASAERIDALERGSTLLGSGGGGPTPLAATLLRRWVDQGSVPSLRTAAELPPDGMVTPVGIVGATSALAEKLPSGAEVQAVVEAVTTRSGTPPPAAIMAMEAGGVNGVIALAAGAALGLDVVDADLMGRALPRLDQLTAAAAGRGLAPVAISASGGWTAVFDGADPGTVERLVRAVLPEAGGWACVALRPIRARGIADSAVVGSLRHALWLGEAHLGQPLSQPPADTARLLGGRVVAEGRVVEVNRQQAQRSFVRGSVYVRDSGTGALVRLEMENEYLLALHDGQPVATTPDLLCVVNQRTGVPVACDEARAGLDCYVLHLPGAAFWRAPERMATVAPRAFELDIEPRLLPQPWQER